MHPVTRILTFIILSAGFAVLLGCGRSPLQTAPSVSAPQAVTSAQNRAMLGLWQFRIDSERETLDFVPLRASQVHMNALAFMEPPAGVMLAIDQVVDFIPGEITVDIALTHPYDGMDFAAAFDVVGILIGHGNQMYPYSSTMAFAGDDQMRLLNPDGYTRWWNPEEFPPNPGNPQMGYIDGLLGKPHGTAHFTATLNGYKYFASDLTDPTTPLSELDINMRGAFVPGTTCIRRYQIAFTPGNLVFNYAVDANWAAPTGGPDIVIPDDFPFSANRPEPYRIEIQNLVNTLKYNTGTGVASGTVSMSVYVYDWQDPGSNMACAFSQNDELVAMCNPFPSEVLDDYAIFELDLWTTNLNSADDIHMWYGIESDAWDYQGFLPAEVQGAYFRGILEVEEE